MCMSETRIREEICRLGRSLFERGLTPGSSGNISVKLDDGGWLVTPTNASLGSLDPARMSRLGPDGRLVSGDAPTKEVPLHTALYQTRSAARAVVHLHSTHSVALSMLPEIDPRAALPPMTPYYLMKCGQTALVPYYRPGDPAVADAIKGLAGKYSSVLLANHGPVVSGDTLEAAVLRDRGTGRDGETLSAAARAEPAVSVAGAGEGFDEGVWADAAGAWALTSLVMPVIAQRSEAIHAGSRHGADGIAWRASLARNDVSVASVRRHSPRYAFRTSGLTLISAALPCISTRPVCRM